MKKTKLFTAFLLLAFIIPNVSLASENLFYYFNNKYGLTNFKKYNSKIDIIAPQIYTVGYDLKIKKVSSSDKKIISEAKKKRTKVMPLIVNANFDKSLMSEILASQTVQDEIIDFMIKEAKKNKYIGWQFDFENINHFDRDYYTAFAKKAYEELKENDLQFSVAVVVRSKDYDPNSQNQDWSSAYDYKKLAENADFLSLMTYDEPYSDGPVASLPYVNRTLDYMLKQAPAEKLSLGIPAYCWQWQGEPKEKVASVTYDLAKKAYRKVKDKKKTNTFDEIYGAEKFSFTRDGIKNEIWCDNAKSWEIKLGIVENLGLRGISVWALGQEDKDVWKLLK